MTVLRMTLLIPSFFFTTAHAAGLAGLWRTTSGEMVDTAGRTTPCSQIEITMSEGPGTLTTEHYSAQCGTMSSSWGPDHMEIVGEKVMDQGEEIGTFANNILLTKQRDGSVVYTFNLELHPRDASGVETLASTYAVSNFAGTMGVRGVLTRIK